MLIKTLTTPNDILELFDLFKELRPHILDKEKFLSQVIDQQKEGYRIIAIKDSGEFVASIGYRFLTTLAWGKILYIDDLITRAKNRCNGYGKILLDHIIEIAGENLCKEVHLDSGYGRHAAHKLYLKSGFELNCHHLAVKLK
jgi:hypothetical protein